MMTVIVPAHNEEKYIDACLSSLVASRGFAVGDGNPLQVVVAANGCSDATVARAQAFQPAFAQRGWRLDVLDLAQGNKPGALNAGDRAAVYNTRAYIDTDIVVSPDLLVQLAQVLDRPAPAYASGQPTVPPAASYISDRYARFWQRLPFVAQGVPGFGVYAVNEAGRARWATFPQIISDDSFVRLSFTAAERHGVPATYAWPITEGFVRLVRVRRRQDEGLAELRLLYPDLPGLAEDTAPDSAEKRRLFRQDPLGFGIYAAVATTVRLPLFRNRGNWDRGR